MNDTTQEVNQGRARVHSFPWTCLTEDHPVRTALLTSLGTTGRRAIGTEYGGLRFTEWFRAVGTGRPAQFAGWPHLDTATTTDARRPRGEIASRPPCQAGGGTAGPAPTPRQNGVNPAASSTQPTPALNGFSLSDSNTRPASAQDMMNPSALGRPAWHGPPCHTVEP